MPQAPFDLCAGWPGMERQATKHLEDRGYKLTRQFTWIKPPGLEVSDRDNSAMDYLFFEWDFDGLEKDK